MMVARKGERDSQSAFCQLEPLQRVESAPADEPTLTPRSSSRSSSSTAQSLESGDLMKAHVERTLSRVSRPRRLPADKLGKK